MPPRHMAGKLISLAIAFRGTGGLGYSDTYGDRKAISFGAGYSPTEDLTLDLAVSYLKEEDVNVNRTKKNQ